MEPRFGFPPKLVCKHCSWAQAHASWMYIPKIHVWFDMIESEKNVTTIQDSCHTM